MHNKLKIRFFILVFICICGSSCKVGRFFWYNYSNITDYKIFPSRPLDASATPFRFIESTKNEELEKQIKIRDHAGVESNMGVFLENSPTIAFLIIRNDSLLYERYFDDYTESSIVASFSVAKSYTSALVGIAIGEGKIGSEEDLVIQYLPELKGKMGWDKITIHHLLQMSSGIKFSEGYYSPFTGAATLYYGRNLRHYLSNLQVEKEPMSGFDYISVNTQLLGLIVERATGQRLTDYLNEKIWKPLHMEYDASWSIDRKRDGLEKAFCCINARARDFAKFGRLYLNGGKWNGQQIVPADWVAKSTSINTDPGSAWFYNRQWWIGSKEYGDYSAVGHLGQYIFVVPEKNMILVRLGKSRAKEEWIGILRQVASQVR